MLVVNDADPSDDPEKMDGWKRKTKPPIVIDRYAFKRDDDGYLADRYTHLYLFDVATKKAEQLTGGAFDEQAAVVVARRHADRVRQRARRRIPDRTENPDICVIDAKAGATPRQLTTFTGPDEGRPSWSPDGKWIAYLQGDEARFTAYSRASWRVIPAAAARPGF